MADNTLTVTVSLTDVDTVRGVVEAAANLVNAMDDCGASWQERAEFWARAEFPATVSGPGLAALFHALALLEEGIGAHA